MDQQELRKRIVEINQDPNLTDEEKARRRQQLLSGKWMSQDASTNKVSDAGDLKNAADAIDLKCTICLELCVRPVTAPCQHNYCLKCLQELIAKAKNKSCPSCRHEFGNKFAANPRINTALAVAIRAIKSGNPSNAGKSFARINNDDRPDEAFTTERAQRAGLANAASGRIMVKVPNDHFGPIPPEADPRGTGVQVGEWWRDRLHCRQWGAHFPHVAGIAGQAKVGAQSVVLSGGYEDDLDEGDWFLYTGSGGRDLSGNKRTNKIQSFDQTFDAMNKALKLSCLSGLPVRVVRSFKEKRSAYAPPQETPVRYDGIYRIVKCWRKKGRQGHLMCRYLFIRCDNEPAPWSSDESGDQPVDLKRDLPKAALDEMMKADKKIIHEMSSSPYWDWNKETQQWEWAKPPPESQSNGQSTSGQSTGKRKKRTEQERALLEMVCGICKKVLTSPVSAPCSHAFCKPCLDKRFGGQAFEINTGAVTGRSMRVRKVAMPCPCCKADLADFLKTAQINRDMEALITKLQKEVADLDKDTAADQLQEQGKSCIREEEIVKDKMAMVENIENNKPAHALCSEFPEFDRELIESLIEQEEGDVKAVSAALSRMQNQMRAEERKKSKAAKGTGDDGGVSRKKRKLGSPQ